MSNNQLFRVLHKTRTGFHRDFESSPITLPEAEALAARIKSDPDCYAVKIVSA